MLTSLVFPGLLALSSFLPAVSGSAAYKSRQRRDDTPGLPTQPGVTPYCTYWWDDDGSITCADLPAAWDLSEADFLRWNPAVKSDCSGFTADTSYCVEAYLEPRNTTTSAPPPTNTYFTPTPHQTGMTPNCDAFHLVVKGDICSTIAQNAGITLNQFYSWNPAVGSDCAGLWLDDYVCISIIGVGGVTTTGNATTPTTTATPTGPPVVTPTPYQTGMAANCDAFHLVVDGDICGTIASDNGITLEQFYSWNPAIGTDCTGLWLKFYVCVSIVGVGNPVQTSTGTTTGINITTVTTATTAITATTTTTPTGNPVSTPTPYQTGMVSNCDAFHYVVDGDICGTIASDNSITLEQFYAWNPAVGDDCSSLWVGYDVCVLVSGVTPTTPSGPTTTSPGNGITTPTPFQAGMTTDCKTFHYVVAGDSCYTIAQDAGVSVDTLISWNPAVGADCTGLWIDTYACIAVL